MNMKKVLASVAAASLAATAMVVSASAAEATGSIVMNNDSEQTQINIAYADWAPYATITITFDVNDELETSWKGGGGAYGYNDASGTWTQGDLNVEDGDQTIIIDLTKDIYRPEDLTEDNDILLGAWWVGANDPGLVYTISYELSGTYGEPADGEGETNEASEPETTTEAPADDGSLFETAAPEDTAAPADNAAREDTEAASSATEAVDTTAAPAAGDTNATTTDKTSADTGVEGVAVAAGLAIIAAGAVVIAKKRG